MNKLSDINLKRELSNELKINMRIKNITSIDDADIVKPSYDIPLGLENGNKKTMNTGKKIKKIFVWNIPYWITCPGRTKWCKKNCYNADDRIEVYDINRWKDNLWFYFNKPELLKKIINNQLANLEYPAAVRIHSSGDFFSNDYIAFWMDIIKKNRNIFFWCYTRSWRVDGLKEKIKELANEENVNLYASIDESEEGFYTIDYKLCVVYNVDNFLKEVDKNEKFICPEQINKSNGCADCANCILNTSKRDIAYIIH